MIFSSALMSSTRNGGVVRQMVLGSAVFFRLIQASLAIAVWRQGRARPLQPHASTPDGGERITWVG